LIGDLAHILRRSGKFARVNVDAIPRSALLRKQSGSIQRTCTIAGGDDYELCFTAPDSAREQLNGIAAQCGVPLTRIGTILDTATGTSQEPGRIFWVDAADAPVPLSLTGFDHFE
jgi:thiamine-monophosphate kinase